MTNNSEAITGLEVKVVEPGRLARFMAYKSHGQSSAVVVWWPGRTAV
jgi:hypothetical protein